MILYEDKDIIVCHKPAGVPVQSSHIGQQDMVSILNNHLSEKGEVPGIHVVHRLDQPVEGIIVFAKNKKAAAGLDRQISQNQMRKIYWAVCCEEHSENIHWEGHELTDYLVKNGRTNTSSVQSKNCAGARKAELSFRSIAEKEFDSRKYHLIEIHLQTGRHHQIRVQMEHAGIPLYGDRKYHMDWEKWTIPGQERSGVALCAISLSFKHPTTGKTLFYEEEPDGTIFSWVKE